MALIEIEKSDAQNFSGFGDICNKCANQTESERGFDIVTRCRHAGQIRTDRMSIYGEQYIIMTDLTKLLDGSETCTQFKEI